MTQNYNNNNKLTFKRRTVNEHHHTGARVEKKTPCTDCTEMKCLQ